MITRMLERKAGVAAIAIILAIFAAALPAIAGTLTENGSERDAPPAAQEEATETRHWLDELLYVLSEPYRR